MSSVLFTACDIRRVPATGIVPETRQVKREYHLGETGVFSATRQSAGIEPVTFQMLRARCSSLLRSADGLRACHHNESAQRALRVAVTAALEAEDWRELWIILAQMQRWLEVMDVPEANQVWPFWLQQSDEIRAGCSRGTALRVDKVEGIDVDDDESDDGTPAVVKADVAMDDASAEVETHEKGRASGTAPEDAAIPAVAFQEQPPGSRRRTAAPPKPQLCDFPIGSHVLTPRKDYREATSYCQVLSHKEGQLEVDIPKEKPFLLSLDYLRRTSEKNGKPMRKELLTLLTAPQAVQTTPPVAPAPASSLTSTHGKRKAAAVNETVSEDANEASSSGAADGSIAEPFKQKLEESLGGSGLHQKSAATLAREAERDKYLRCHANGLPRHGFRKGSTPPAIKEVMGGNGTVAWPVVKNEKAYGFVKNGEAYVIGNRDFNPWSPAFAGDHGFLGGRAMQVEPIIPESQTRFHVFSQCCRLQEYPFTPYHGESMVGAYIYCGLYEYDDETPEQTITFEQLGGYGKAQDARVKYYWEHELLPRAGSQQSWTDEDYWCDKKPTHSSIIDRMRELGLYAEVAADRKEDDEDDANKSEIEKNDDLCAFRKYLLRRNEVFTLARIVCVDYVEAVYEALVKEGAFAKCNSNQHGIATTEVDPAKLGYLNA